MGLREKQHLGWGVSDTVSGGGVLGGGGGGEGVRVEDEERGFG